MPRRRARRHRLPRVALVGRASQGPQPSALAAGGNAVRQAVMVWRWFKDTTDLRLLARDAKVSIASAYWYAHEAIDLIAAYAPDLHDALAQELREGWAFVCLDGTLIHSTRSSAPSAAGHAVRHSRKHKRHGGTIQVLTGPTRYPEWVSDVEPSTHDSTTAGHTPSQLCIPPRPRAAAPDR